MSPGLPIPPRRWWPGLLLVALGLLLARTAAGGAPLGEGEPLIRYFSPREYHADPQSLCAVQDTRGIVYVGNIGSVLEYDGSTWRKIDVGHLHAVAGLAYEAATDTVYVGARDDVGYLRREPDGGRTFVSLLDQLPAADRDVGVVLGVYATPEGVYFVGTNQVMRWREGRFRAWTLPPSSTRLRSNWAGGHLHIFNPDHGLLRLDGDALVPASADPLFRRSAARTILDGPDGSLLVGTFHDGLFTLRDGVLRPFPNDANDFLKEKGLFKMARLPDGGLAVATDSTGVLVLDREGRFRSHFDETGGLHGGNITNLFVDAEGGLWIPLQNGVARAEVDSPLSILRAGAGDEFADVSTDDNPGDRIFFRSGTGLYRAVPADPAASASAHLEPVPGVKGELAALCVVANGVLVLSDNQLFLLGDDGEMSPVPTAVRVPRVVRTSRVHPGRVYVAGADGEAGQLHLDPGSGRWIDDGIIATTGGPGEFEIAESADGDLWLGTKDRGLFRARPAEGGGPAAVTSFIDRPGPLQGQRYVISYCYGGPILFNALGALYRPDATGQGVEGLKDFDPRLTDGSLSFYTLMSGEPASVWIVASDARNPEGGSLCGRALAAGPGRAPAFQPLPHKVIELLGEPRDYFKVGTGEERADTVLIAGASGRGLVRLDTRRWEAQLAAPRAFDTLIRRALVAGREPGPIPAGPLPFARNSLHFEYAAGTMAYGAGPQFQTRLAGFGDGGWSDWSERTSVDYLNLPEGRYTFEVRARDADGQLGRLASQTLRVLPPWQRSPPAYASYALALGLGLWALLHWRGRWLHRRNAALATVVEDRTAELRQREAELVRARDDADAANRAKSAFLANMSHELRTPLNAVLGYTQLLLKQTDLSARSRERVTVIGQSGGHLLALVNEVLDLAKVEAGKLALNRTDFLLPPLLDEVAVAFRPRLAEKGLSFTETRAPDLPAVVGTDGRRLRQVLFNLLGNAVKFTHHGGVSLNVRPEGEGRVRFEVADTGVGIEPEELRDIFLAFHQAGGQRLSAQGTGLGLAISQRLVELLGGRIEVESTPGRGSRFWFDLPLAAGDLSRETDGRAPPADAELGPVTGYEGAPLRLLLVDDVTETRQVLRDFLQPLGFEIEEAADGAGCLAACARVMPDAVLLDLRLGKPDGFEVARTLRARADGPVPRLIAISASVFESDRQRALEAGCDDFLSKPLDMAQLLGALSAVLGIRWLRETSSASENSADLPTPGGEGTLPSPETDALLELSLRGDVAGIRKHLEALRAADGSGARVALVRRLESLAAAYDMEGIHELLLVVRDHPEN